MEWFLRPCDEHPWFQVWAKERGRVECHVCADDVPWSFVEERGYQQLRSWFYAHYDQNDECGHYPWNHDGSVNGEDAAFYFAEAWGGLVKDRLLARVMRRFEADDPERRWVPTWHDWGFGTTGEEGVPDGSVDRV
jgi:hypothetical protein